MNAFEAVAIALIFFVYGATQIFRSTTYKTQNMTTQNKIDLLHTLSRVIEASRSHNTAAIAEKKAIEIIQSIPGTKADGCNSADQKGTRPIPQKRHDIIGWIQL